MARSLPFTRCLLAACLGALSLAAPAVAKADNEFNVYVWKVTRPAAAADAPADYMIGTMHVSVTRGQVMPEAVLNVIGASSTVVTEANTADVNPAMVAKYMRIRQGKPLKERLSPAAWKKLLKATQPMGVPPEALTHMEPWFLNLGMTLPAPDGTPVIDELVAQEAKSAGVRVEYLEGAEQQLQMMDSVRPEEDIKQLLETLDQPEQAKTVMEQLRAGYFSGDAKRMERLVFDPVQLKHYPDFYQKLIFSRNAAWVPKVEKLFLDEDAVVAVGLGHLLGDKGLVKLLQAKGYKVERLAL